MKPISFARHRFPPDVIRHAVWLYLRSHNITADVEVIPIQKVNEAYERLLKSDVRYRFSIDMASLKSE
jgi:D-arabinose 1-dehydrogenase-like Zn-dependent alcohol dehydrogenase